MLVFSSALRMWSLGPRGWPCQRPAYRSRIGSAFSAKCGSRGKIPYLYRHGLIASVSRIRHTVLRLSGLPNACANAEPDTPKGPRVGRPPHGVRAAPGRAAEQVGIAERTDAERSCVGAQVGLAAKSPQERRGRISVWVQAWGISSQSEWYSILMCRKIV